MFSAFRPALVFFLIFSVVTGLAYPLAVTGVGQLVFPHAANGSPVVRGGRVVGSALIGQSFVRPEYFWGRPSAAGAGYDAKASGGSNLGPTAQALADRIKGDAARYGAATRDIPADLLLASGSGLDPEISLEAARFQAPRVAAARHLPRARVMRLIDAHTQAPIGGILGEARVNVLELNLGLDTLSAAGGRAS